MNIINFYNESNIKFLPRKKSIETAEKVFLGENINDFKLNIVILNDDSIHRMNKEFLNHDYPTDVITFTIEDEPLEGEIYISSETAKTQAVEYGVSLKNEILRLVAHGCLHLSGYDDNTDEKRNIMHNLENKYIA